MQNAECKTFCAANSAFCILHSAFDDRPRLQTPLRRGHRRARPPHPHLHDLYEDLPLTRLDWVVLIGTLLLIVAYGVWKGRRQRRLAAYLLADRQLKWPTIALSIMATQASAITFLSTPGQAYADGMRFVQFYLGLPIAMVILSITAVPIYHRLKVYTAYEYLETRFGVGTRTLTSLLFLLQRGLSTGITLYAPALIVSVILGWNIHITNIVIGGLVIIYTTSGGTKAVSWTHVHQLLIALGGMTVALIIAIHAIPPDIT